MIQRIEMEFHFRDWDLRTGVLLGLVLAVVLYANW